MISVADAMTERMVDARIAPQEKFTTIYSGMEVEPLLAADEQRASTRAALGYADDHVVIIKVARLFYLKGHEYLIAAMKDLAQTRPNLRLLLVGDGILRPRIERQIARAGLGERVKLLGLVPPAQIPALLAASEMIVHTSLREGLARSLAAGLIAARPAVSFDIDGAREVVIDDETGYLIPPKDIPQLTEAIDRLAGDAELRRRLGGNGRALFTEQFRHERMTAEIRRLYLKVLAGQGVVFG
jgi:glycosyltransferase involved in cell wall biosynthesis